MVSDDKQYEHVSQQVRHHNDRILGSFDLFIRLFSAVVGGAIWLSLQAGAARRGSYYALLSDLLVGLITVMSILMVLENLRAWHGYRWAQTRLGEKDESGNYRIPPPKKLRASLIEIGMVACMLCSALLFLLFNRV